MYKFMPERVSVSFCFMYRVAELAAKVTDFNIFVSMLLCRPFKLECDLIYIKQKQQMILL